MPIIIKKLTTQSPNFNQQLAELLAWNETDDLDIQQRVLAILADVRNNGDEAVINYSNRFDHRNISDASELELPKAALQAAWENLPAAQPRQSNRHPAPPASGAGLTRAGCAAQKGFEGFCMALYGLWIECCNRLSVLGALQRM